MTPRLPAPRGPVLSIIAPLALLVAFIAWAFASPVASSPDEDYHLTSIWCAQGEREGICLDGPTADTRMVWDELVSTHPCYAFSEAESAACSDAPHRMVESDRGNFTGAYPPVYYVAMSVFASENIESSVIAMRITNAVIFVGLGSALFFLLRGASRGPLVWGALISVVPLGMFLIPSLNPSSWAITAAVLLWISLYSFLTETELRRRILFGVIAGLATVMASGARADAAIYSGLAAVLAVILSFRRTKNFLFLAILPVALSIVAFLFFRATGQSAIVDPGSSPGTANSAEQTQHILELNLVRLPALWSGSLGTSGLGWLDTPLPPLTWVAAMSIFFAVVFWGLQRMDVRKGLALAVVGFGLIAIPLYILTHDQVLLPQYVQPRYVFPLLIVLAGVALLGFRRNDFDLGRTQIWVMAALLAIANAAALHTNLRRYVSGSDRNGFNLNEGAEWWWDIPRGPMAMWLIGTLAFSVALVAIVVWSRIPVALVTDVADDENADADSTAARA